jgi:hypothetical protein
VRQPSVSATRAISLPFTLRTKLSSTVISSRACWGFAARVKRRRKKRSPSGALLRRSAPGSGDQIQFAPRSEPLLAASGEPEASIHFADQSAGASSPISQRAGALQAEGLPSRPQTRTFHQHSWREASGLPA